jgi:hypothetical protein
MAFEPPTQWSIMNGRKCMFNCIVDITLPKDVLGIHFEIIDYKEDNH